MRFAAFLTTAALLFSLIPHGPALAQGWPNDTGPGGDLLTSSGRQFDRLRQAAPQAESGGFAAAGRAAIPMLDWVPPAPSAFVPAPEPAPRRTVRRAAAPRAAAISAAPAATPRPASVPAPAAGPPAAPVAAAAISATAAGTGTGSRDWERSLAEREKELDALRRRLEEDRRRFETQRPATAAP
ncbi:hypothetical protein [Teichococcus vastitatis]|uniref:Uncharacterized protein n=1 Tax=Teichococcus vastitatis TaxID=2307076 RepID=A0ABS9WC04_9PROT|nr:hypothetical protein [Pseudoroseomonas vastitatis]MCI0756748.1 hypothetical protein [Pseudoroseomonas vastitatis]